MEDVYVIGAHTIPYGKYIDKSLNQLSCRALQGVLSDACIKHHEVESTAYANSLAGYFTGQHMIRGNLAFREAGFSEIPVTNVESACAGGILAFYTAYKDILSGLFDCSLALGVEKLYSQDKELTFNAFYSAMDVEKIDKQMEMWESIIDKDHGKQNHKKRSPFMDVYAAWALWHMEKYGTTRKQLSIIASKNHNNGSLNPHAQYKFEITPEEVLNDYDVSYPLTRSMCAPVGDGASAVILCSPGFLKKLPHETQKRAVKVKGCVFAGGKDRKIDEPGITERAGKKLYEQTGVGPEDIDLAEVHDATSMGELLQYEALGFCKKGFGGEFAEGGNTSLEGKIPVNTSGGLISRGHPISASGLAQIYEIICQLRMEAGSRQVESPRLGLVENGGGIIGFEEAAAGVGIFEKN